MKAHRRSHSEICSRPTDVARTAGRTNGSRPTGRNRPSRFVPVFVVLTAAMILLCRPITATAVAPTAVAATAVAETAVAATAADGESTSTQRVVTDKSAGLAKIPFDNTALSGIQRTQSVASPKQTSAMPTDPQDAPSSTGRSNTCPATNKGVLSSVGGSWSGSTTFSTDNFEAAVLGCDDVSFGRDEIFQFTVDAGAIWKFDTCTVPAGWDTTLSLREEVGGGCPGEFRACDGDGCNVTYFESAVSALLTAGPTYYLIVDGWSSEAYGDFTVTYQNTDDLPGGGCSATDLGVLGTSDGSWSGDTTGSSDDFDASVLGCADLTGGRDEIFQFTVAASGIWNFDTCTVPAGWDTTLSLHEEVGGGCPGDFIACDGDGCDVVYYESLRSASLSTDSTYYLIVDGWSSAQYGPFTVTHQYLGPVPNGCGGSDLGVLSSGGGSWIGSTIGSTDDFHAPFNDCVPDSPGGAPDEIFQFTVDVSGTWTFDTCTPPVCWDTNLSLRKETGGGCPGDFVTCDDDGCTPSCYFESALDSFVEANVTYYLIIDSWSTFSYGDFEITYANTSVSCSVDAQCDDGVFCNGSEVCETATGLCFFGLPPCQALADCDEDAETCNVDPCITWRAGRGSGSFFPQANNCPNLKTWVLDDIQGTHLTSDVLDYYTTPLVSSPSPTGASPIGTTYFVDQAIWTVEFETCNPLAFVPGTTCSPSGAVGADGLGVEAFPCSGTMPVLPNNSGDFDRCEVDFFIAYRTAENGAGMWLPETEEFIGGPGAADDFGINVIWIEGCPSDGVFTPIIFTQDDSLPADFATAEVCQKPGCGMADLTDVVFADANSIARLPVSQPGHCAIDAREPHSIADAAARSGWDRMVMSFTCSPALLGLTASDFSVNVVPAGLAPSVGSIDIDTVANTATVILSDMIMPGQWTCISHPASGGQWCMGYLPADASQDGLSSAGDISALINSINLVPGFGLPFHATDINRSGVTTGADILRLIDLLNGAGEFTPWIAAGLPLCP